MSLRMLLLAFRCMCAYSCVLTVPGSCMCRLVDEIVWVKMTVNRRLAKSHGYYLQHAKEVCLVGKKGKDPPGLKVCLLADLARQLKNVRHPEKILTCVLNEHSQCQQHCVGQTWLRCAFEHGPFADPLVSNAAATWGGAGMRGIRCDLC